MTEPPAETPPEPPAVPPAEPPAEPPAVRPPLPNRPPRPLVIHWLVDSAIAFVAVIFLAFIAGIPIIPVVIAALVVGACAAPLTRRAEIRALELRAQASE